MSSTNTSTSAFTRDSNPSMCSVSMFATTIIFYLVRVVEHSLAQTSGSYVLVFLKPRVVRIFQ
ncbi:hypothetical protein BJV78DRAFT_1238549 [Lactifluus subvellereus]|nr:hypothetical protein BJV78DRAFT_1238549 [Lactifluus subvellereus]